MIDRILDRTLATAVPPEELKAKVGEYADLAWERMGELSEQVKTYTVREPARALGVAFGLGVLLGCMIKRR